MRAQVDWKRRKVKYISMILARHYHNKQSLNQSTNIHRSHNNSQTIFCSQTPWDRQSFPYQSTTCNQGYCPYAPNTSTPPAVWQGSQTEVTPINSHTHWMVSALNRQSSQYHVAADHIHHRQCYANKTTIRLHSQTHFKWNRQISHTPKWNRKETAHSPGPNSADFQDIVQQSSSTLWQSGLLLRILATYCNHVSSIGHQTV